MKLYGVSSHVVYLLTFAFEGCARSGRERPIHLSKLPILAAMPKRFCNNREASELFRFGSIILYLRLHGTYSGYALHSQRAGANLCSTLHLGSGRLAATSGQRERFGHAQGDLVVGPWHHDVMLLRRLSAACRRSGVSGFADCDGEQRQAARQWPQHRIVLKAHKVPARPRGFVAPRAAESQLKVTVVK